MFGVGLKHRKFSKGGTNTSLGAIVTKLSKVSTLSVMSRRASYRSMCSCTAFQKVGAKKDLEDVIFFGL